MGAGGGGFSLSSAAFGSGQLAALVAGLLMVEGTKKGEELNRAGGRERVERVPPPPPRPGMLYPVLPPGSPARHRGGYEGRGGGGQGTRRRRKRRSGAAGGRGRARKDPSEGLARRVGSSSVPAAPDRRAYEGVRRREGAAAPGDRPEPRQGRAGSPQAGARRDPAKPGFSDPFV